MGVLILSGGNGKYTNANKIGMSEIVRPQQVLQALLQFFQPPCNKPFGQELLSN